MLRLRSPDVLAGVLRILLENLGLLLLALLGRGLLAVFGRGLLARPTEPLREAAFSLVLLDRAARSPLWPARGIPLPLTASPCRMAARLPAPDRFRARQGAGAPRSLLTAKCISDGNNKHR
jgi:hypothetical protein